MTQLIEMIVAFPVFGLVSAFFAHRKGYDFFAWWLFGTVVGVIAAPIAIFALPRKHPGSVVVVYREKAEKHYYKETAEAA